MKNHSTANPNLEVEDWSGKLHEIDLEGSTLYSAIVSKGLGKKSTTHRNFNWIEDKENSRKFKPTALATNNVLTVTDEEARTLIKDDMLWCSENGTYLRVIETPGAGATTVKVAQVNNNDTEKHPVSAEVVNKDFFKYSTAKEEGSKDGQSYVDNPEDFFNTLTTFEDFAETSLTKANESWQLTDFTQREYEKAKKLKKHKKDINYQLYIGQGYNKETRQMNKGITNFNGLQKQTGYAFNADNTLNFDATAYDLFMYNKVKKVSTAQKNTILCNNGFLLFINALVRQSTSLNFNAFGVQDSFGFNVKKLVHMLVDSDIIVDNSLNDLYPNRVTAFYLELNKMGIRHLQNLDTKITLGVQDNKDNVFLDKIYTIGGGLQLIHPACHTMLDLKMYQ